MGRVTQVLGWVTLVIVIGVVGLVSYRLLTVGGVNERVAADIRANSDGALAAKTMLLTLADDRMYPVNFLHEGNYVFVGIDGRWWREFVDEPQPVQMFIQGETLAGQARTILDDPARKKDLFSRLRPTVPKWLPDALNAKLVEITLDPAAGQ